ncbi:MAG: Na+/H+ antiporter subunit E [Cucumibacter sp.]
MLFVKTLIFALVWTAITGSFTFSNLVLGAGIGALALWVVRERLTTSLFLTRVYRALSLFGFLLVELVISGVRVALLVVSPRLDKQLNPGIIAFPLKVKSDVEITLLANMITLTPGTLSVDVSEDRKTLFVHAIAVPSKQALIRSIADGFERRIIEAFE